MSLASSLDDEGKLIQEVSTPNLNVDSIDFGFGKSFRAVFLFGVGQFKVVPDHINWLAENAVEMLESDATALEMYGGASSTGSDARDLELSTERLFSVFNELIHQGITQERLLRGSNRFLPLGKSFAVKTFGDNKEAPFARATVLYLWPDEVSHRVIFAETKFLQFARAKQPPL